MWIRFWSGHSNNPLISNDDDFFWVGAREDSDETLYEEARERVPQWVWDVDARSYFGFERLEKLPDDIRMNLVKKYENMRDHAIATLEILSGS